MPYDEAMKPTPETHQFRVVLIEQMRKQGITSNHLAKKMKVSHTSVRMWVNGKTLPTWANISLLADYLDSPGIAKFGHKALERTCEFCGKKFNITELRYGASKTCSQVCSRKMHRTGMKVNKEIKVLNAIADYCRTDCEFGRSGSCRNSACFLAPFTPLPFDEPSMRTPSNRRPMSHEDRQKRSEWSKKYFEVRENREKQAARTREALAGLSEAQKEAHRNSISKHYENKRISAETEAME
jgi:hypothetical protein